MAMKFRVKMRSEVPPDRADPLAELAEAFAALEASRVLFVSLDGSGAKSLQGLKSRLTRRLGKDEVVSRADSENDGVWIWPKQERQAGGSNGGGPFTPDGPRNRTGHVVQPSGSGAAAGAGAR